MTHLFTYGSLMFENVWHKLVKGNYLAQKATLHGYERRAIKDDVYPVIFKANTLVEGVVYYDVSDEDLVILDTFEGEYYERKEVELLVESTPIKASAYILKEAYFHLIDTKPWSDALFAQEGIQTFLEEYKGFH
jgi:gamma-glutamylcyclotransferase (GGCT)/AIG2-like uncharacterized protein YtfP